MTIDEREMVPEDELRELFRPHSPVREEFRAGVARRAQGRRQEQERADEEQRRSPLRASLSRRAAALIGVEATALQAGKLGATKLLPTALALPALLLAGALGAVFAGARSVRRTTELPGAGAAAPEAGRRRPEPRSGWAALVQPVAFIVFFAPFLLGARHAIDIVLLVLLASMACLVATMRKLADGGMLTRARVRQLAAGILIQVLSGVVLWLGLAGIPDAASDLGLGWSVGVLIAGLLACAPSRAQRIAFASFGLLFVLVINPLGWTRSTPVALRRQLAGFELRADKLTAWNQAAAVATALRTVGADVGDLGELRRTIETAIETGVDAHPVVWTAGAAMGLIGDAHWQALAERDGSAYRLDQLVGPNGRLVSDYDEYQVHMLLATRELSDAEQQALLATIERGWPDGSRHDPLKDALLCVRAFDVAGRPDLADAHRADVQRLLVDHWVGADTGVFGKLGGFTSNREKFRTSFDETTWKAVLLMQRLGVPDGVDLRVLRGHLRAEARSFPMLFEALPYLNAHSRAAKLVVEESIGMPPRTWYEHLLGERLLLAALGMVGLCLLAIRQTREAAPV